MIGRSLLASVAAAFTLLTRLPVARLAAPSGSGIWAFPLVGAVVGLIAAAAYWAAARLGLPPTIGAILAVGVAILVTGGLHEDGLADTADGFGGGASAERKLAIMRDSRIGSYGALALLLAVGLRVAALAALAQPARVAAALVVAETLGRGAIVGVMLALGPARPDGMAARLGPPPPAAAAIGIILACLVVALPHGLAALLAAGVAAAAMGWLARRQVGGYTGDVLGATQQIAAGAALVALLVPR